jgi:hypothetical protein
MTDPIPARRTGNRPAAAPAAAACAIPQPWHA